MPRREEIHCNGKHEEHSRKNEVVSIVGLPRPCPRFVESLLVDGGTWGCMRKEESDKRSCKTKVTGYLGEDVGIRVGRTKGTNCGGSKRFGWYWYSGFITLFGASSTQNV